MRVQPQGTERVLSAHALSHVPILSYHRAGVLASSRLTNRLCLTGLGKLYPPPASPHDPQRSRCPQTFPTSHRRHHCTSFCCRRNRTWSGANDPHEPQWFTSRYFDPGPPFPLIVPSCFGLRKSVLVQSVQTPTKFSGRASSGLLYRIRLTDERLASSDLHSSASGASEAN